ncbi:MAG: response regulator transcription factor [Betaproteobacteria bacterium]
MKPPVITALLADEEGHQRLFLKTALATMGLKVVAEAANGREAVAQYRKVRPDVAFLDVNMPLMNGREALAAIREEFPDALVIMLTSVARVLEVEACLRAGAANYLRKDTPLAQLRAEIRRTCSAHMAPH